MELLYRDLSPSLKRGSKIGLGILLVLAILGSGIILQTSYARTLDQLDFDFARSPLAEVKPDPYRILIDPQLQRELEGEETMADRTITVSGSGQAGAQPDQAVVRLGVQTEAETAEQALAQNNDRMRGLLATLEESGIPSEDIQTQALQVYPRYDNPPEPQQNTPQVTGYTAANTVEITVRELDRIGELLDAVVKAGGNTIQGIQFELSDRTQVLDQARQAAVAQARHKAEQLTSLLGAELGEVLTITETGQAPGPVVRESLALAQASAVPIEPGTQSLQVEVQVTWLLR